MPSTELHNPIPGELWAVLGSQGIDRSEVNVEQMQRYFDSLGGSRCPQCGRAYYGGGHSDNRDEYDWWTCGTEGGYAFECDLLGMPEYCASDYLIEAVAETKARQFYRVVWDIRELASRQRPASAIVVDLMPYLVEILQQDISILNQLAPATFEELILDRLTTLGLVTTKVSSTSSPDGGIDLLAWPSKASEFPFLMAVQCKHHRLLHRKTGRPDIQGFMGSIGHLPIDIGMIVTNTGFTPHAEWFAQNTGRIMRLRDINDVRRWVEGTESPAESPIDLPKKISIAPNLEVDLSGVHFGRDRDDERITRRR